MSELGQPRFRTNQLIEWLYGQGVASYQEMTNLPLSLREELEKKHPLALPQIVNRQVSTDGTRKYLIEFADGAQVETVAIPTFDSYAEADNQDSSSRGRLTACLSTQVGCPMGCLFCATGLEGFTRDLLPGEIVDQIHIIQNDFGMRVSNLVIMGQGEAFLNYDNTIAALRFANSPKGLMIGARHITISTCGILSGISRLAQESEQFTLAVSLHSAEQVVRNALMPRSAGTSLSSLRKTLLKYVSHSGRRVSLEYLMIDGVNDDPKSLKSLVSFCDGLLCHVNLLPINTVANSKFKPSSMRLIRSWEKALKQASLPVSIRDSRGSDIDGACGQLKNALH